MKMPQLVTLASTSILLAWFSASVAAAGPSVRLYNWSDFIAPETSTEFTKDTNIPVVIDTFDSAEMMQSKLLAGRSGYDVVMVTSNVLPTLIESGVLQRLDRKEMSNWSNLDPAILKLLQANDPGNLYAVPYLWGTTGIGYDVDKVKAALGEDAPVNSWDLIFKEENISRLKRCGVAMLDSPSEILSIALHYLGLPHNSKNPDDYKKAQSLLLKIRPYISYFNSGRLPQELANGNICVMVSWAGDASVAMDASENAGNGRRIAYSIPKEGALVWSENLVLLKNAPHPEQGAALINYLMRPEAITKVSNYTGYPNGNKESQPALGKKFTNNPDLRPTPKVLETLFPLEPLPFDLERLRTRVWTKVKGG